ncbi:MAG: hypothetical protein AB1444_11515 [Spirochaetota bacterium]
MLEKKQKLCNNLRKRGLLWSYDTHHVTDLPDDILLEHVMKYGDVDDIYIACEIYGKETLKKVWEKSIKYDSRFIKLSVFLARVIFGLDIEGEDIKKAIHEEPVFRRFNQ